MPRIQHPETGRFVENWVLEEGRSDGCPTAKLFLPSLPPPWRSRWHRKRGRYYVDAIREGWINGKPPRLCRRPETIRADVQALETQLQRYGELAGSLSHRQQWIAAEAFLVCERLGVELFDVVREFEKMHPHGANARTLDQVRAELIEWKTKTGRSTRHVAALQYRLGKLIAALGDKPVTAITTRDLEKELARHPNWNPTTVHSAVQGWKIALNFAIRRGYLVHNPADRLELPKIIHAEPTVFTLEDVRKLMAATLFADRHPLLPACRAYLAIGLFGGLRPESEIAPLLWKHVDLATRTIRVVAANAKDRVRRIVDIQPNLAAWLAPLVRRSGPVLEYPIDKLRSAARAVLGLSDWPTDIMRHTFVSNHFAEWRNEAATKQQVGHRDDGRVFYNHYMVPLPRWEAHLFWGIFPPVDVLPCYDAGWLEKNPPMRLALAA